MTAASGRRSIDHFVRGLYDGITDAGYFDRLMRRAAADFGLYTAQWTDIDWRTNAAVGNYWSERFPELIVEYERDIWPHDPRIHGVLAHAGQFRTCWEVSDAAAFDKSWLAGEWTDRKDVDRRWGAGVVMPIDEQHAAFFTFIRPRRLGPVQLDELKTPRMLARHLRRAAELRLLLAGSLLASGFFADQWGSANRAVFWLGSERRVLARNMAAERLLSLGYVLTARWGRLAARTPHDDAVLEAALQAALREPPPPAQIIAPLSGTGEGVAWKVRVVSLGSAASEIGVACGASLILAVDEVARSSPIDPRPLLRLGLRPTEAVLTLALNGGLGLQEAAAQLGLNPKAARHMLEEAALRLGMPAIAALLALAKAQTR
jgi:hypothetical protein